MSCWLKKYPAAWYHQSQCNEMGGVCLSRFWCIAVVSGGLLVRQTGRTGHDDPSIAPAFLTCSEASSSQSRLQSPPAVLAILASTASITAQLAQAAFSCLPPATQPQRCHPTAADFPSAQAQSTHLEQPPSATSLLPHFLHRLLLLSSDLTYMGHRGK